MAGRTKIFPTFTTTFVSRVQLNIQTGNTKYTHHSLYYCISLRNYSSRVLLAVFGWGREKR